MRLLLPALLVVGACDSPAEVLEQLDSGANYVPAENWRTASAASAGFDAGVIEDLRGALAGGRYGRIDALLVVRFGYLIHEQYVGWTPSRAHTLQSVSKSITSLLYGISAREQGEAARVDRPVLDLFSDYLPVAHLDTRKQALTMRHLLTMRTAMDFWEQPYPDSPLDSLNRSSGWPRLTLLCESTGKTTWRRVRFATGEIHSLG